MPGLPGARPAWPAWPCVRHEFGMRPSKYAGGLLARSSRAAVLPSHRSPARALATRPPLHEHAHDHAHDHDTTMSASTLFRTGAAFTATGMGLGAFGAHALKARYPGMGEGTRQSWMTGSSYLIYNGLALMAISAHPGLPARLGCRRARFAAGAIVAGALTFTGSIVGLVLDRERLGRVLGPLTPIGGVAMIAG